MVPRPQRRGRGHDCVFAIGAAGGHMRGNEQEPALANNPKTPAEGQIAKAQRQADGKKAMAEYEASAEAMRAKTEKLRALRLARDAANPPVAAPTKAGSGGKAKSAKKGKAPKGTLAD